MNKLQINLNKLTNLSKLSVQDESKQIPFPVWMKSEYMRNPPWRYVGWIARESVAGTFENYAESSLKSDHGEKRETSIYPQGAICWMLEPYEHE